MLPEHAWLLGAGLLPALAVFLLLEAAAEAAGRFGKKLDPVRRREEILISLPEAVGGHSAFREYVDVQLKRSGWKLSPAAFLALSVCLASAGVLAGAFFLKNVASALACAVVGTLIPFLLLNWAVQRYEQKVLDQLPTAVHLFSVEYEATKSVPASLLRASEGVGPPLSGMLRKAAQELGAGRHPKAALGGLASDLGCEHGRLWARLLAASYMDTTVLKLLPRLSMRLNQQRLLSQKSFTEISYVRRLGLILNTLVVPGFVATQLYFPDSAGFYTTPVGRAVIVLLFLSVAAGIFLDYTFRRVEL